jgi:hypothetical protein
VLKERENGRGTQVALTDSFQFGYDVYNEPKIYHGTSIFLSEKGRGGRAIDIRMSVVYCTL